MKSSIFTEVVLAGLLHDLGKFAQRTGEMGITEDKTKGLYCHYRSDGNYFTHEHTAYTDAALALLQDIFPLEINIQSMRTLAARHHVPEDPLDHIISVADRISAGSERASRSKDSQTRYYQTPLTSIFSRISLPGKKTNGVFQYRLSPIDSDDVFPVEGIVHERKDYLRLWSGFIEDAKALRGKPLPVFIPALVSLMERYTWCIPSSTSKDDEPDISLFDHLVTTAAFSAALYRYHESEGSLENMASILDEQTKKFLFVSGDVSGIQRYIFDLKSDETAAKILRARSFEIQYLSDSIARLILSAAGMPALGMLMNAGGRFLVVLPNVKESKGILDRTREKTECFFLQRYFGELTINISNGVPASYRDLQLKDGKMEQFYSDISLDVESAKGKKLQAGLRVLGHIIHSDYDEIQRTGAVCSSCRKRPVDIDGRCSVCNRLRRIGEKLPKARYVSYQDQTWGKGNSLDADLLRDVWLSEHESEIPEGYVPYTINTFSPGYPLARMPYHVPMDEDRVLTFDEIADSTVKGVKKIAMVKADLDNLGFIFQKGIVNRSISRYAALSRMLNLFFTSFINAEIEKKYSMIYTVFSGGDDLCVIGPWSEAIEFALEVRKRFSEFTGGNKSLTISAGIVMAGNGMPMRSIARTAEHALERAKDTAEKNSVTLFGHTLGWEKCREMVDRGKRIVEHRETGKYGNGIVYRLLEYGRRRDRFHVDKILDENSSLWRSHFCYDAARNIEDKETREWFKELAADTVIEHIVVPASYALYMQRKEIGSRKEGGME